MIKRFIQSSRFKAHYKSRIMTSEILRKEFRAAFITFRDNPDDPSLANHELNSPMKGYFAFSINGDYRVVYLVVKGGVLLVDIGTHEQVYRK
jgi:mRNA-degrading endonuclease YafQ of YafQ-DinJ toxin-antitoxin module